MRLARGPMVLLRELAAVALLIVVWQVVVGALSVPAFLLPAPTVIGRAIVDNSGRLGGALAQTSIEAALGFVGGNVLGLGLAASFARSEPVQRVGLPLAIAIRSVPLIAITPLLTIVFGYGPATIVIMATLISFFPALVAGLSGSRAASAEAVALMRVLDASGAMLYRRLRIPAALPFVFAAFKISAPASVLAAMVAEWTAANSGLGYLIVDAGEQYRFALMWAGIAAATALAVAAFGLASAAERRFVWWPVETA